MENRLVILTLTYNRPENLRQLFDTLKKQSNKDFVWMIVDDGSPQDLKPLILEITNEADFLIEYYRKENGGKASATNYAFDRLEDNDFVVIIDDDEFLYSDAVDKIKSYAKKYQNTDVGVLNFTRDDLNGKPLSHPVIEDDFVMSLQEHRRKKYHSDGYMGYFMNKLGKSRFPIFDGEKYVGPSVMIMLVSERYKLLWCRTSLGYTDYLEGGLTKKGRLLRLRNPRGMAFRCLQMLSKGSGVKEKFGFSIQYFAYLFLAGTKHPFSIKDWNLNSPVMPFITKPIGFILYKQWVRKYLN